MEIKIVGDNRNEVLGRREIEFEIIHSDAGTPDRFSVRKALASKAGSKLENVYVLEILNYTGTDRSLGRADVYENRQAAERALPQHLLIRNMPPEERAKVQKAGKAKKPEAKKTEEKKPAEKKAEEKKEEKPTAEKPQKEAKKA
jgi:ribosomal protein S24E